MRTHRLAGSGGRRFGQRLAFRFRFDLRLTNPWLPLEQGQLGGTQTLGRRPILAQPEQAELLFQELDLQVGQP